MSRIYSSPAKIMVELWSMEMSQSDETEWSSDIDRVWAIPTAQCLQLWPNWNHARSPFQ